MMRIPFTKISNFALFYIGWLVGVYYHTTEAAYLCLAFALFNVFVTGVHLRVLLATLAITTIGVINDSLVVYFGVLKFSTAQDAIMMPWLAALWLLFASTYHSSLSWVKRTHWAFQAVVGAIAGAITYIAGTKLNAMVYVYDGLPQFLFHCLNWVWLYPLTLWVHGKISPNNNVAIAGSRS